MPATLLQHEFNPQLDLRIERLVDSSPEQIWSAWTNPELVVKWFAPKPWRATSCELDLRPGGKFFVMMQGPEGQQHPCNSCLLELVENRRIVWTDALNVGYRPSAAPFITAYVSMEPQGGRTMYSTTVLHKDETERARHIDMGFYQGWNQCIDQLIALFQPKP